MFKHKTRDQIVSLFSKDEMLARTYYNLYHDEFRYAYVDTYSFEKFLSLVKQIHKLRINFRILDKFQKSLEIASAAFWDRDSFQYQNSPKESHQLLKDLVKGKSFLPENKRTFTFKAIVKEQSSYEEIVELHKIWRLELKSLLFAKIKNKAPQTLGESEFYFKRSYSQKAFLKDFKLIHRLKLSKEVNFQTLKSISKDLRFSLLQRFAHDKKMKNQIHQFSEAEAIFLYLKDYLPQSAATLIWKKKLEVCMKILSRKQKYKRKFKYVSILIDATFLDKNKDFIRALRFTDTSCNCLHSTINKFTWTKGPIDYKLETWSKLLAKIMLFVRRCGLTPINCIAMINKDPLAFIIDLKEHNSNYIFGFTMGKIGIDPDSRKPIVMLNGIYTTKENPYTTSGNPDIEKHIVKLVEQQIVKKIHAEKLIIPLEPNNSLRTDPKFHTQSIRVEVLTALSNSLGFPKQIIYDDYGDRTNDCITVYALVKSYKQLKSHHANDRSYYVSARSSFLLLTEIFPNFPRILNQLFQLRTLFFTVEWLTSAIPYVVAFSITYLIKAIL